MRPLKSKIQHLLLDGRKIGFPYRDNKGQCIVASEKVLAIRSMDHEVAIHVSSYGGSDVFVFLSKDEIKNILKLFGEEK